MAKNLRKIISMIIALALCIGLIATPAAAYDRRPGGGRDDNQDSDLYEWYQVYVQGNLVASGQGSNGNVYYLGTSYKAGITPNGHMLTWYINPNGGNSGNFSGTVDLRDYINIPDGYTVKEYTIEESSIDGVNNSSSAYMYDNAIIKITISTIYNEETGEEIEIPDPTDPSEPTEPSEPSKPIETEVTVNHIYKTYDVYTGKTTEDGTTSSSEDATEGDSYTAIAAPSYKGNAYTQQTDDAALTITIMADAAANVINIEYLRTIDTTPEDYIPVLEIVKTADQESYIEGDTVTWTITVINNSEYTAYNVVVTDELTGESWTIDELAPGLQKSFIATLANAESGLIENVAVVTWEDGDDIPEDDDDNYNEDDEIVDVLEDLVPVLDITKTADQESYIEGDTVTWTITVKNISEYTAYNVVVTDELTGESWTIDELAPGAEQSFTASLENAEAGLIENVAVVTWEDGDDIPEDDDDNYDEDDELVEVEEPKPVNPAPVLTIIKTSSKYLFETGETVTWYISIYNGSAYAAHNVIVTDELTGDTWRVGTLEPGASRTFAATTETTEAGSITNVAVVTWTDGDDIPDNEEPDEIKKGSDDALVIVNDPAPDPDPQDDDYPVIPADDEGEEILDEDVPLAAAPKTGDISGILEVISLFSLGGMVLLSRKKKEE